jgi:hypothetical protein
MATGVSKADLAVLLIDARKSLLVQTRRLSLICSLLGLRHIVVAVNKIDLVSFQADVFDRIATEYRAFASQLGFTSIMPIPISARYGDNITELSGKAPSCHGPTLLDYLETIDVESDTTKMPFRFPVQWVNRPNPDFRGYAGTIVSGALNAGDPIAVASSGQTSIVKQLLTYEGPQVSTCGRRCHDHARGRDRYRPRRSPGQPGVSPRTVRSIRRTHHLDGRLGTHARPLLFGTHWHQDPADYGDRNQIQDRRQYPRASGDRYARPQRHRLL